MKRGLSLFVVFVLSVGFVSASLVVSSPYHNGNSLSLEPGANKDIQILLSNPSGDVANVAVSLLKGEEIAQISGETTFKLDVGDEVYVPIKIEIPENAEDSYEIKILSDSLEGEGKGSVKFSPSYVTSFFVFTGEVANEPVISSSEKNQDSIDVKSKDNGGSFFLVIFYLALSFLIIAMLIVITVYLRRKKFDKEYASLTTSPTMGGMFK